MKTEHYTNLKHEFGLWLDTLGFAKSVTKGHKLFVTRFFTWLETQNINSVHSITAELIHTYFEYLQTQPNTNSDAGLSVRYLNHLYHSVDKFCEFLHQMGMDEAPSPTLYRLKRMDNDAVFKVEAFTQEEIKILKANIENTYSHQCFERRNKHHQQLKLTFTLCYGCGLRKTEAFNLTTNDIDFDRKTVFVNQGKNYKDRIVPMSTGVYKELETYLYDFRNTYKANHNRLYLCGIGQMQDDLKVVQQVCNSESIQNKRLTLHILRHSIATHLLQNGMSIEKIAHFLGHSNLESTQIYTHLAQL